MQELKKSDLFDLGVVLTICATDSLDMLNEEYIEKLCTWNQNCCIAHAVAKIDIQNPDFDPTLKMTLITLKHILCRLSPTATDFICILMR
jgi:hypothetical protein